MLTLKIQYPDLPVVVIEGNSQEVASLLLRLGSHPSSGVTVSSSSPISSLSGAENPNISNRRDRVVVAMGLLKQTGKTILRLDAIRLQVSHLFPEDDGQHLDQVVRDLVNKTNLVERCDRGTFRLTDRGLEEFQKFNFKSDV